MEITEKTDIIDLSVNNASDLPCWWPTVHPFHAALVCWYDNDWLAPCFEQVIIMEEHTGTHFDAPPHFIPDPKYNLPYSTPAGEMTVEKVPLQQLMGEADVIDVSTLTDTSEPGESPRITADHVKEWEKKYGKIDKGEIVLFKTEFSDRHYKLFSEGGSKFSDDPIMRRTSPAWPGLIPETMHYLCDCGVKLVGIDATCIAALGTGADTHRAGLGKGLVFVEKLINLKRLPPRGAFFIFLPMKNRGAGGAPGRAIALLNKINE